MPSVRVSHLEERESKPKRLYATVEGDDGGHRQVTLTIFLNTEAQKRGLPCVENHIYTLTPRKRRDFLQGLFYRFWIFQSCRLLTTALPESLFERGLAVNPWRNMVDGFLNRSVNLFNHIVGFG